MSDEPLLDTVEDVEDEAEKAGDRLTFGDILDRVEERGYGPLITILSAFVILPTGMIPGVPALVGTCLLLIGAQMLASKDHPWFPRFIRNMRIDGEKLDRALEAGKPWAGRLSALLRQRLCGLVNGPVSTRVAALVVVMSALVMIPFGFIPGLPLVFGGTLVLLGIGITARDGLVLLVAYAIFGTGLWLALTQAPGL